MGKCINQLLFLLEEQNAVRVGVDAVLTAVLHLCHLGRSSGDLFRSKVRMVVPMS